MADDRWMIAAGDDVGDIRDATLIQSYSSSIGWNEDGSLRVTENGEVLEGEDAARVVGAFGMVLGWRLLEVALDPDGTRRAEDDG